MAQRIPQVQGSKHSRARALALVLRVCKRAGAHEQPRHVQATVVRRKVPTRQRETRLAA
jgi:hypothetical protein